MLVGGWADGYRNNTFRTVQALRENGTPHRLLLGPWSHMSTATSLPGPHIDLVPVMARWWDRWLRGIDDGYDDEPALTWFQQASTRPGPDRALVEGEWRTGAAVAAGGCPRGGARRWATARWPTTWSPDVGTAAWNSCAGALPWGQPTDQRYDDAASLTWEWPADGTELLGHPRLRLRLSSTAPVATRVGQAVRRLPGRDVVAADPRAAQPDAPLVLDRPGADAGRASGWTSRSSSRRCPGRRRRGTGCGCRWPASTGRTRSRRRSR